MLLYIYRKAVDIIKGKKYYAVFFNGESYLFLNTNKRKEIKSALSAFDGIKRGSFTIYERDEQTNTYYKTFYKNKMKMGFGG